MSDNTLNVQLRDFKAISLNHLNEKSSFLKRIQKKYLIDPKQFLEILKEFKQDFDILEINGKKVFTYDNIYMDTEDYFFYKQHQDKLDFRTKVRTRFYVDSNIAFFEFKHKKDGIQSKYRYEFPIQEHGFMTKGKKRFFDGVWQTLYENALTPEISPSIKTNYKRISMVSKKRDERLTIDFVINITNLRKTNSPAIELKNLIIIESKSLKEVSLVDKIMQKHKIERSGYCSKYSLGIIYSGLAEKYDTFKETIERVKEIRMETVKDQRSRSQTGKTSLNQIIRNIKKDTRQKVKTNITK